MRTFARMIVATLAIPLTVMFVNSPANAYTPDWGGTGTTRIAVFWSYANATGPSIGTWFAYTSCDADKSASDYRERSLTEEGNLNNTISYYQSWSCGDALFDGLDYAGLLTGEFTNGYLPGGGGQYYVGSSNDDRASSLKWS